MAKFEIFNDISFYGYYCVRPIDDKDFNSPLSFHFPDKADAQKFLELIEKAVTVNIRKICCETCNRGEPTIQDRITCGILGKSFPKAFHCSRFEVKP